MVRHACGLGPCMTVRTPHWPIWCFVAARAPLILFSSLLSPLTPYPTQERMSSPLPRRRRDNRSGPDDSTTTTTSSSSSSPNTTSTPLLSAASTLTTVSTTTQLLTTRGEPVATSGATQRFHGLDDRAGGGRGKDRVVFLFDLLYEAEHAFKKQHWLGAVVQQVGGWCSGWLGGVGKGAAGARVVQQGARGVGRLGAWMWGRAQRVHGRCGLV